MSEADTNTDGNQEESSSTAKSKKELLKEKTGSDTIGKGLPPRISFRQKSNSIGLSKSLSKRYLDGYDAISFIYDEDNNDLWIVPLEDHDPNAIDEHDISEISGENSGSIQSKAVMKKVGKVDIDVAHRYYPTWDEKQEALKVDLDDEPEKPRKKTEKEE